MLITDLYADQMDTHGQINQNMIQAAGQSKETNPLKEKKS